MVASRPRGAAPLTGIRQLSASGELGQQPVLAVSSTGRVAAAWLESRLSGCAACETGPAWIEESTWDPDSRSWSRPVQISSPTLATSEPQVTIDARGNATVVWFSAHGVAYASQSSHGSWTKQQLIDGSNDAGGALELASNRKGEMAVSWWSRRSRGHMAKIFVASRGAGRSTWGQSQAIATAPSPNFEDSLPGTSSSALAPQIAVNNSGATIVVWHRTSPLSALLAIAIRRPNGRAWQTRQTAISTGSSLPTLTAGPGSGFTLAWLGDDRTLVTTTVPSNGCCVTPERTFAQGPGELDGLELSSRDSVVSLWGQPGEGAPRVTLVTLSRRATTATSTWAPRRIQSFLS